MSHGLYDSISRLTNRFWSMVDRGSIEDCWLWDGPRTGSKSYGAFCYDNSFTYAHRFSYMLQHGEIPDDKVVMHLCDNPLCVNPRHLVVGTQKQNVHDSLRKGRWMTQTRKDYLAQPPDRLKDGTFAPKRPRAVSRQ